MSVLNRTDSLMRDYGVCENCALKIAAKDYDMSYEDACALRSGTRTQVRGNQIKDI